MSIVEFPARSVRIWVCDCGCSTFRVREDGEIECAACNVVSASDIPGAWFDARKGAADRDGETTEIVQGNGSVEFVRARLKRLAASDDAALIAVALRDGRVSLWAGAETDDEVKWSKERLEQCIEMLGMQHEA